MSIDWNDLQTFLALQRAGTLAGAADALRLNATTVGRRIAALEEQVGARLFDRTRDGYLPTQAGRDLVPHAERMEAAALAVAREVAGSDQRVAGVVRLSTTEMIGTRFFAPQLWRFHQRHPDLTIDLSCQQRSVSLARREADIVVRLSRPREDDVVARPLAQIAMSLYASPEYLERRGRPAGDALAGHDLIFFAASSGFALENDWLASRAAGARIVLRSDSVSAVYAAAAAGLGIALLPRIVADGDPGLERIPTETPPESRQIWQGIHKDLARTPRIRVVAAFVAEVVGGQPGEAEP